MPFAMVALRRCLYTFFLTKDQPHLAEHSNYEEIFGKQLELLVSSDIAADVYDVLGIDGGVVPMCGTWVEFALRQAADMTDDEYDLHKGELHAYHRRVSMRMASHLQLTVANISPTLTLAPQLLSKDATKARQAAVSLERRLVEIPVGTARLLRSTSVFMSWTTLLPSRIVRWIRLLPFGEMAQLGLNCSSSWLPVIWRIQIRFWIASQSTLCGSGSKHYVGG